MQRQAQLQHIVEPMQEEETERMPSWQWVPKMESVAGCMNDSSTQQQMHPQVARVRSATRDHGRKSQSLQEVREWEVCEMRGVAKRSGQTGVA